MAEKKAAAEAAPKKKRCFMITPIGEAGSAIRQHADWVFNFAVKPVMEERGYEVSRSDKIHEPFMITDSIFEALTKSDICIADLTSLNANVFYELGIRHALEEPVIHIAQSGTTLPFDNAGYRTIMFDRQCYDSMSQLQVDLNAQIDTIEKPGFKLSNPLTQFRGRGKLAESADSRDQVLADLQKQVASLSRRIENDLHSPAKAHYSDPNGWTHQALEIGGWAEPRGVASGTIAALSASAAERDGRVVSASSVAEAIDRENRRAADYILSQHANRKAQF